MPMLPSNSAVWASIALAGLAHAHIAAFHPAMYCVNGTSPPNNNNAVVNPLYNLAYDQYWVHQFDNCPNFPPPDGVYLDLYAGQSFTVELADNKAFTSLDPDANLTDWGDGQNHPSDYSMTNLGGLQPSSSDCIPSPNLHAQNQSQAAGTSFAIAYKSDISSVNLQDLIVFTVRYNTPWMRVVTYDVPSGMPACPQGGCICTWNWIPNGCGQENMYMVPYKCNVIPDSTTAKTIGTPKAPVWCQEDPSTCVTGPKQIMIWNQQTGNNINVSGNDLSGEPKSPAYNEKCGFNDGAQNDIFAGSSTSAGSGTPALYASVSASSLPTTSGIPALASTTPTFSLPAGSGTPTVLASAPTSSLPAGSGTPTVPASVPASSQPAGSGTSTGSAGSCKRSTAAKRSTHSKRMITRREKRSVF